MVLVAGFAYVSLSVLDAGVFGALLAVLLSRPGKAVSAATLALGCCSSARLPTSSSPRRPPRST